MSFARAVRPVLPGRRRYSSFFSKHGGGRMLNAPKSVVSSAQEAAPRQRPLSHPVLNEQECRLFQFYALDRPLVLMTVEQAMQRPAPGSLLDLVYPTAYRQGVGESELPADADAETARQIMRSLTMNIVGGVHDWENTLKRLGIDVNMEPERVGSRQEMEIEWREVLMDSTKRKRRRKMKKHKLKKRRRALRQRVKK